MAEFTFEIYDKEDHKTTHTIRSGEMMFLLGANGTGKSALMQRIFSMNAKSNWVIAHRAMWLDTNSAAFSANDINSYQHQIRSEGQNSGRVVATYYDVRRKLALVQLVSKQNAVDRQLAEAVRSSGDQKEVERLKRRKSPIDVINEIFKVANMDIEIRLTEKDEFFAVKDVGMPYIIQHLSDGEKNAFMLCAEVLTADEDTLFLLDEPERHLHRSISAPLLNALLDHRPDCAFIIATHDLELPATQPQSPVLLLRSVILKAGLWQYDQLTGSDVIPDDVKMEILGARQRLLFVEGKSWSLDKELYQLLFPSVSVYAKEGCAQVERAVEGIRANPNLTWAEAFGLIDADDRTAAQIAVLEAKGVFALPAYSVEYLYYNPDTIRAMANYYAGFTGAKSDDIYNGALAAVIANLTSQRERLCARVCEKKIGERITRQKPSHKDIVKGGTLTIIEDFAKELADEIAHFDGLVAACDVNGLLIRYPFRETQAIDGIIAAFKISRTVYEQAIRKMVQDGKPIKTILQGKLGNIVGALATSSASVAPPSAIVSMPTAAAAAPKS